MKPRASKALIGVLLVHALLILALANAAPGMKSAREDTPVEIAFLEAPKSEAAALPPPPAIPPESIPLPAVVPPLINIVETPPARAITAVASVDPALAADVFQPKLVSSIEYVRAPMPKYPKTARSLGQRGLVILRALIDASGRAIEVSVQRSAGFSALDEAARQAVLEATFKPYTEDGRAQPAFVLIPIEFDPARRG